MLNGLDPRRLGGLRHLSGYLTHEFSSNEAYAKWLKQGTDTELAEAEQAFNEWRNSIFDTVGDNNQANENDGKIGDIVYALVTAAELSAFERGARFGAQMQLDLLGANKLGDYYGGATRPQSRNDGA